MSLTPAGFARSVPPAAPPTREALFDAISAKLSGPQAAIFRMAASLYPQQISREAIAAETGKSPNASGFQNDLGRLRTLGLITYPVPGQVRAADHLFGASAGA